MLARQIARAVAFLVSVRHEAIQDPIYQSTVNAANIFLCIVAVVVVAGNY